MQDNPDGWFSLFESKVNNIFIRGKNAYGICPFHEDRSPSFAVNIETSQWICHAGCGKGNYQTFKSWIEDPSKVKPFQPQEPSPKEYTPEKVVATYIYKDAEGTPLYEVRRLEPKSFRQNRIGASNMDGVKRVPYQCDIIYKYPDRVLIWVEGEKDVDSLRKIGIVASTSSGGANGWKDEYAEMVPQKYILLIPDQDEAGEKYIQDVARSFLLRGKTLFRFNPVKKDISDMIKEDSLDGESLLKILAERSLYVGSKTDPTKYFNSLGIFLPEWKLPIKNKHEFLSAVSKEVFGCMDFWSDRFMNPVDMIDLKAKQVVNNSSYQDFLKALKELHETRCFLAKLH